jgi:hypothetical protein
LNLALYFFSYSVYSYIMEKDEKGYVALLLVVLIAFGFFLSGGLMPLLGNLAPTNATRYVLEDQPVLPSHQTLQLATLMYAVIPVTTTCDPDAQNKLNINEPYILYATHPGSSEVALNTDTIKMWYIDEHPVTLGRSGSGYAVSPIPPSQVQATPQIGDPTAREGNNLPVYPALYLTNITSDPTSTIGDAQNGGAGHPPTRISGAWIPEGAGDSGIPHNGPDVNPSGVGLVDPLPAQSNIGHDISGNTHDAGRLYYAAEIEWNIAALIAQGALQVGAGNTYRAQFVVHDGDNSADLGVACTTIQLSP